MIRRRSRSPTLVGLEELESRSDAVDQDQMLDDRRALDTYLSSVKSSTDELNVTLLTTLQCNFACDYCFQGDHGDYNLHADKMSLETAGHVGDWLERERPTCINTRN